MTATSNRLGQPNLGAPRMFYWVAGIELRSGTRQEFRIPQLSKVLTIRHGGTYSFRYNLGSLSIAFIDSPIICGSVR